jgi:o-succinylbenzoate synthase
MKATYQKYVLDFNTPSGTSRGVLHQKETWFLILEKEGKKGIGECGLLRGLSCDDREDYEEKLQWVCENIALGKDVLWESLIAFPSIQFGVEMAFLSIASDDPFLLFPSDFTAGNDSIEINGLIWMGNPDYMKKQILEKIAQGFRCVKLKIGAIEFQKELELVHFIRSQFSADQMEIRVDANGGFDEIDALYKINQISGYQIHSIEQPIQKNKHDSMSYLCKNTTLPIALDEELIGVHSYEEKEQLIQKIMPQYLILKPSFIGGIRGTTEWIELATKYSIGWWVTSALESNIGLNAIAQWTYLLQNEMPQGLGTGSLYSNNFKSPLEVKYGKLFHNNKLKWDVDLEKFNY